MRSGVLPLVGWGLAVVAVSVFGVLAFGLAALPAGLLAGGGALSVLVGLGALAAERRRPRAVVHGGLQLRLDGSVATAALSAGLALVLVGAAAVGPAIVGLGGGLALLGAGGIVREIRAGRRLLRDAEGRTR